MSDIRPSATRRREPAWLNWKTILACVLVAIIAGRQFNKTPPTSKSASKSPPQRAVHVPLVRDLRNISTAYAVTRPNPDIVGTNQDEPAYSSAELFSRVSRAWTALALESEDGDMIVTDKPIGPESRKVLHHSFDDLDNVNGSATVPYKNGLVDGIIRAFQQDLHLVLRPDDVWLAIMVQFSFYINGHAEEMRDVFVTHKGKEELIARLPGMTIETLDVELAARIFAGLIQQNVVEPDLQRWILPSFSTTTDNDVSVASMVMMATMKDYFEYTAAGGCGFPSVTLLGERADWVDLLGRVERLAKYGDELANWSKILVKVVEKMIETYDKPDHQTTKDFRMSAVHQAGAEGSGQGIISLSGWITAFSYWDVDGSEIIQLTDEELESHSCGEEVDRKRLVIDDISFPIIQISRVPRAVAQTPVKFVDLSSRAYYKTTVVAGGIGMTTTASEKGKASDNFQPRSGWWMLFDESGPLDDESYLKYRKFMGMDT